MNNDLFKTKQNEEDIDWQRMEVEAIHANNLLYVLKQLQNNTDWLEFVRLVVNPSMKLVKERIDRNLKDLVKDPDSTIKNQIIQDQGALIAYEKISDLKSMEKLQEVVKNNIEQHLKKHAKKEDSAGGNS